MELTRNQIKQTKGIAIIFMILLHLFATKNYKELFTPSIMIGTIPLTYYIGLFGDSCVAIYCFCSGYGLMLNFKKSNLYEYKEANYREYPKFSVNSKN